MEPKILCMGDGQNYYELNTSWKNLDEKLKNIEWYVMESEKGEEFLNSLRIEHTKIKASQFRSYGSTFFLETYAPDLGAACSFPPFAFFSWIFVDYPFQKKSFMAGLMDFFEKARDYAKKYNVSYVLIQNFEISSPFLRDYYKITGSAQLLIE